MSNKNGMRYIQSSVGSPITWTIIDNFKLWRLEKNIVPSKFIMIEWMHLSLFLKKCLVTILPHVLSYLNLGIIVIYFAVLEILVVNRTVGAIHTSSHPLRGRGGSAKGWCYTISLFIKKRWQGGGRDQKSQKMGDIIYERPLSD